VAKKLAVHAPRVVDTMITSIREQSATAHAVLFSSTPPAAGSSMNIG
jgi:hypothetical protein